MADAQPIMIPPTHIPVIDPETGLMNSLWYMFFMKLAEATNDI